MQKVQGNMDLLLSQTLPFAMMWNINFCFCFSQIDVFPVWNAWGHALIRMEHYVQARVKFKYLLLSFKRTFCYVKNRKSFLSYLIPLFIWFTASFQVTLFCIVINASQASFSVVQGWSHDFCTRDYQYYWRRSACGGCYCSIYVR